MMKMTSLAALLAAAALAACGEQTPQPRVAPEPAASQPAAGGATTSSSTSTKPATSEERKEGANPVQQQVDPKEAEQRRDFKHPNEKAGPTSPETQPKSGG
jgi:ABC-type glycerol-3-phosphate transport system substrate-binding protein